MTIDIFKSIPQGGAAWKMQIKGAWGTSPTNILQRKSRRCIYDGIACTSYTSFQGINTKATG